jgi:hypothetical protein
MTAPSRDTSSPGTLKSLWLIDPAPTSPPSMSCFAPRSVMRPIIGCIRRWFCAAAYTPAQSQGGWCAGRRECRAVGRQLSGDRCRQAVRPIGRFRSQLPDVQAVE